MGVGVINWESARTHFVTWSLFWSIDYVFAFALNDGVGLPLLAYSINAIACTIYFYICVYFIIIPHESKSLIIKIIYILFCMAIFIALKYSIDYLLKSENFYNRKTISNYVVYELWRLTSITLFAFAYWFYLKSIKEEKQRRRTEEKLLKAEIDFLKAQINPHFMFNTLNFVYNDVVNLSSRSGDAIMSLTKLLRYSVESTKSEHTTVGKELEIIDEYIKLQRLRFGDKLALSYTRTGNMLFFSLPPLVLVSLVENAFKYGIHDDLSDPVTIEMTVNSKGLKFLCRNRKRLDFLDKETTAVGYSNIKRRLEMTYGDNFTFDTRETENHFEVVLDIVWKV